MTERVIIFIIIASVIVAVTLIAAVMQMVKSVSEASASKYSMIGIGMLKELRENGNIEEVENAERG